MKQLVNINGEFMKKMSLNLMGMRFFGHYGYYPEEQLLLTELILDVTVDFQIPDQVGIQLEDTLNYESVYQLIRQEMNQPEALLESIALRLIKAIKLSDNRISYCSINLSKKVQLGGPLSQVRIQLSE